MSMTGTKKRGDTNMILFQVLATKWFCGLFIVGATFFIGYANGKSKGWDEYEKIEKECRAWK